MAARITPSHLLFDLPAVYFIGRSERIRWRNLGWAFAVALLLHGTWNYLAFLQEIWFIPYVFLLTMAACASVVFLSSRSRYERRHRMLDSLIEHNIYMLRQGRTRLSEDREAQLLEKFREVKRRLQALKFLRGYEQERVARRLHDVLPVPISDYLSGPGQAEARLEQALEGLKALPLRRFDWSYYAGLAILLFSAAFFAFLIINFLNHFLLG